MAKSEQSAEYTSNIRDLLRFLTREGERGYAFVTAIHEGIIPAVNQELIDLARQRGKVVELLWYEDPKDLDISFAEQLRQTAKDADAVIVNDLDRAFRERAHFIDEFNFSREAINALEKPVLFWLTPESLSLVGNRAADLFSQRSMMTVQFENAPEITAPAPELERRFTEDYRSKEDYEALKIRVNLLKKQLNESLEAGMPRRTIAADIALPLAKTYSELDLHEEALELLEQFKEDWDEDDARELFERGKVLADGNQQPDAIVCLQKAQSNLAQTNENPEMLGDVHIWLGNIYREIGKLAAAVPHYEANLRLREVIAKNDPDNVENKSQLGSGLHFLAVCYEAQGKLAKALELFEQVLEIREELYEANPSNNGLKRSLAVSYSWIGCIHETQGKLGKALAFFEKDNRLFEEFYTANTMSETYGGDLVVSYNRIGNIYALQGKLSDALLTYEKNNRLIEKLLVINPLSKNLKQELAISFSKLGDIYVSQGKLGKALEFFEKYNQLIEELYMANPMSEGLKRNLAVSYNRFGGIYESQGKLSRALVYFEKNKVIFEALSRANPESENIKRNLAVSYARIGAIYETQGKSDEAIPYFERHIAITEELWEANPLSEILRRELTVAYGWLGSVYQSKGQLKKALSYYEKRRPISEALCLENVLSEDLKSVLVSTYFHLEMLNARLGKWYKALYWSVKGLKSSWQLCRYIGWKRHKLGLLNSILNFIGNFILFPPLSIAIWWLNDKIELLYKRLRYGVKKPTPPPTSEF